MRSSYLFLLLSCVFSLFFHPLLWSSFFSSFHTVYISIIFPFLLSFDSQLFFPSLHSLFLFLFILPSLSFSSFISFFFLKISPLFSSIFKMLALFPLIGHNHNVWKTLTQVKPLIFHLRKLRLIETEFSKITCYILETPSY